MSVQAKICGLSTPEAVKAAVEGGAAYVGFVFFGASPRNISLTEFLKLAPLVPVHVRRVALCVDADDQLFQEIAATGLVELLQLHGHETPQRVREIKLMTDLPVMKVLPVASKDDLSEVVAYEGLVERFLFDAKPPKGATRPGGNALTFDWTLLNGLKTTNPWMLAGGLDIENISEAVAISEASIVDVSSAVEDAPGVKSPDKIRAFLKAVSQL